MVLLFVDIIGSGLAACVGRLGSKKSGYAEEIAVEYQKALDAQNP
jgi:hypothetical protein